MIAQIGTTDITSYIQESSYKINNESIFDEWTDGNHIKHRVNYRKKAKGSFEMVFIKESDLNAFLALCEANTTNGLLKIKLRIDNENIMKEIEAHADLASSKRILISSDYMYNLLTLDLEEA